MHLGSPVTAYSGVYIVGCSWKRAGSDFEIANYRSPSLVVGWSSCWFRSTSLPLAIISSSFLVLISCLIVVEPCKFDSQRADCQAGRWYHLCGLSTMSGLHFEFEHFRFGSESFGWILHFQDWAHILLDPRSFVLPVTCRSTVLPA